MPRAKDQDRPRYARVALPVPVHGTFDYCCPAELGDPVAGVRVRVPLGRREAIGVVLDVSTETDAPPERIKPLRAILDAEPLFDAVSLKLLQWAAGYYLEPMGQVLQAAMPQRLRQGSTAAAQGALRYHARADTLDEARESLRRAPRQKQLLDALAASAQGLDMHELSALSGSSTLMKQLIAKGWAWAQEQPCLVAQPVTPSIRPVLGTEQAQAVEAITAALGHYETFVLAGVTGSGKTEVYLSITEQVIQAGGQVLVLAPEIALTPQFVSRFRARFSVPIAVLHSGLSDRDRHCAWWSAATARAPIVIGTRSAVFTPMPRLGAVIIDEEHDLSYKQQEGFRYHARDVAVYRARLQDVPVVLGSATPSLESLHNVARGRYRMQRLTQRAGDARPPTVQVIDLRSSRAHEALSAPLITAMRQELDAGGQVLLFINRRGYAPVLVCGDCGWDAACTHCDARMTLHVARAELRCHHCDARTVVPERCPSCLGSNLKPFGAGTQRVEQALEHHFPGVPMLRIDRDSTQSREHLESLHRRITDGEFRILVGTQMLSKGHDFPDVGLVGVLNVDQSLHHTDFRAIERFAQLLVQVSGRAGRGSRAGRVLVQTLMPEHPVLNQLLSDGYFRLADRLLSERAAMQLPPHTHMALLRADAGKPAQALEFLTHVKALADGHVHRALSVLGPVPAPMERRQGRHRAQLLFSAGQRSVLHATLQRLVVALPGIAGARSVRWSLDTDPMELF